MYISPQRRGRILPDHMPRVRSRRTVPNWRAKREFSGPQSFLWCISWYHGRVIGLERWKEQRLVALRSGTTFISISFSAPCSTVSLIACWRSQFLLRDRHVRCSTSSHLLRRVARPGLVAPRVAFRGSGCAHRCERSAGRNDRQPTQKGVPRRSVRSTRQKHLLSVVLSNCSFRIRKIFAAYLKPFDIIVKSLRRSLPKRAAPGAKIPTVRNGRPSSTIFDLLDGKKRTISQRKCSVFGSSGAA